MIIQRARVAVKNVSCQIASSTPEKPQLNCLPGTSFRIPSMTQIYRATPCPLLGKGKVKQSLCLTKHYAMKEYGGVDI
jgi:hypothetical protein